MVAVLSLSVATLVTSQGSALAMDCSKAASRVELTICADPDLKAFDDRVSKLYFETLKALRAAGDDEGHNQVQGAQRNWIRARDACARKPDNAVKDCIERETLRRLSDLAGEQFGSSNIPAQGLSLGAARLRWAITPEGRRTLTYQGRVVLEEPFIGQTTSFTVLERWKSYETEAALVEAGAAASAQCSSVHVVENRRQGGVRAHDLGLNCVSFDPPEFGPTEDGFRFIDPAAPGRAGKATQWRATTGELTSEPVNFHPSAGSTLSMLVASTHPETEEPLRNDEFYSTVMKLGDGDRERVFQALWQVANGCRGCSGADNDTYGITASAGVISYSGCGWFMDGARIRCTQADALAVLDRRDHAVYFATDEHRCDEDHDGAHLTPPLEKWPAEARARFELWRKGPSC